MKAIKYLLFGLFLGLAGQTMAQYEFEKAQNYFYQNQFEKSIELFEVVLKKGTNIEKFNALGYISDAYTALNDPEKAERYARLATSGRWQKTAGISFKEDIAKSSLRYAFTLRNSGKYQDAKKVYQEMLSQDPEEPALINAYMQFCDTAVTMLNSTLPSFIIKPLKTFNSNNREFSPIIYNDSGLVFTSQRGTSLDLYQATVDAHIPSHLASPPAIMKGLDSKFHEGPACFANNGKRVYFTRTVKGGTIANYKLSVLNIFYSDFDGTAWSEPKNDLPFNSELFSTGHPTLNQTGDMMVFTSYKDGGKGGADLYFSIKKGNSWSAPINLGSKINTKGNELFPFISGRRLYFASNGLPGFGKLDVFESVFNPADTSWSEPTNLGYPLNTRWDDFGYSTFNHLSHGFFTSNRDGGSGNDDIYLFVRKSYSGIFVDHKTVYLDNQTFFQNLKYNVTTDADTIPLDSNRLYFYYQAQHNQPYKINYIEDQIISNQVKVKLGDNPDEKMIYRFDVSSASHAVYVHGILRENGEPLPLKRLYLLENDYPVDTVLTDETGYYGVPIIDGVNYSLVAFTPEGEREFARKLFLRAIVKVTDNNKAPIAEASVRVKINGNPLPELFTNVEGITEFKGQGRANVQLSASKVGFSSIDTTFELVRTPDGADPVINIVLSPEDRATTDFEGIITDAGVPLAETKITATNIKSKETKMATTGPDGKFKIRLHENEEYNIVATKGGYFQLDTIVQTKAGPVAVTIELEKLQINKEIRLSEIYYDYDQWNIRKDALPNLKKAVEFMEANPRAFIELNAHTDSRGSDNYNLTLSQRRSEAARNHLITQGVDARRIIARGYGEYFPVITNATSEFEHQQNRRTQFKVLGYLDFTSESQLLKTLEGKTVYYVNIVYSDQMINPDSKLLTQVAGVKTVLSDNHKIRYFLGPYDNKEDAEEKLNLVSKLYPNASVEAWKNGKPVPLTQ